MANQLMFEVGIKSAEADLKKIEQQIMNSANRIQDLLRIQVDVTGLKNFTEALKSIGDGKQLQPILSKIEALQASLVKLGLIPKDTDWGALEKQLERVTTAYENYNKARAKLGLKEGEAERGASVAALQAYQVALSRLEKEFGMTEKVARAAFDTFQKQGNTAVSALEKIGTNVNTQGIDHLKNQMVGVNAAVKTLAENMTTLVNKLGEMNATPAAKVAESMQSAAQATQQQAEAMEQQRAAAGQVTVQMYQLREASTKHAKAVEELTDAQNKYNQALEKYNSLKNASTAFDKASEREKKAIASVKEYEQIWERLTSNRMQDRPYMIDLPPINEIKRYAAEGKKAILEEFKTLSLSSLAYGTANRRNDYRDIVSERLKEIRTQITLAESGIHGDPQEQRVKNIIKTLKELESEYAKAASVLREFYNSSNAMKRASGKAASEITAYSNLQDAIGKLNSAKQREVETSQSLEKAKSKLADAQQKLNSVTAESRNSIQGYKSIQDAIEQLGQKYNHTAEQAQKLQSLLSGGNLSTSEVQRKLRVGFNQATEIVETINAIQKLKQETSKPAPQEGIIDPKIFTVLKEAIDQVVKEINRLAESLTNVKFEGLKELTRVVNGLQIDANTMSESFKKLDGSLKFQGTAEELAAYEKRVKELKEQIASLEAQAKNTAEQVKVMNKEFKSVSEKPSNEVTKNKNLSELGIIIDNVNKALREMGAEWRRLIQNNAFDAGLKDRIRMLVKYRNHVEKMKNSVNIGKPGALGSTEFMFNNDILQSKRYKSMYNAKAVKDFAKEVDDVISRKKGVDEMSAAFARMRQAMLGIGSSATGGMRGVSANLETINKVGEMNIQTLIREQAHIERLMAIAQKSIKFGEAHDVLGMSGKRAEQRANLAYLENVRRMIDYILQNRNQPEWMRFLNTSNSLRLPLPGSGNDIALLGAHFDKLTHNVTDTARAMRQLKADMTLESKEWYKQWNTDALARGLNNVKNQVTDIMTAWDKVSAGATPELARAVAQQINNLNAIKSDIGAAMSNKDLLSSRHGFATVMDANYHIQLTESKRLIKELTQEKKAQAEATKEASRAEAQQLKEAEQYTKNVIKNYNTWAESVRRAGIEMTTLGIKIRQMEMNEARLKKTGQDTSAIRARIDALKAEQQIMKEINSGSRAYGTAKEYIRSEKYQTEIRLATEANTAASRLATTQERADNKAKKDLETRETNQQKYNAALNDMENILKRLSAAEARGKGLGIDTSRISQGIALLNQFIDKASNFDMRKLSNNHEVRMLKSEWDALKKTLTDVAKEQDNLSKSQERANTQAAQALAAQNAARRQATQQIRQQAEATVESRRQMLQTQAKDLQQLLSLGKEKLGTTQYDAVRDALRAIREELRQIQTMTQRGGLSSAIMMQMGSGKNYAGVISSAQAVASMREKAAAATARLAEEEQRLGGLMSHTTSEMKNQSQVLSDLKMMAMQYLSVWGAQSFVNKIIETGGLLEQQRLSLSAILGDMDKASALFGQVKALAVKSPFGVVQIDQMTKQLAAYGFEYEELFDWTKRLGDISAATGTEVSRLALALGHVRSEGALSGYTLRQFSMGNVPLLKMLSEARGVSTKEIRDLVRKKEISDKEVQGVLKQLTDEGGMFYNAQEVMSGALNAKFKNLRDSFDIMYGEIAESKVGDILKGVASALTSLSTQWERFGKDILAVAVSFGILKAATFIYNGAIEKGTATTLKSALADKRKQADLLRLAKSYRYVTAEELNLIKTSGQLTAYDITQLINNKKLTREELLRAVALGKVNKELARSAVETSYLSAAQKSMMKTQIMNIGYTARFSMMLTSLGNAARRAWGALLGFGKMMLPMAAIGAVVDLLARSSQQTDEAMEAGTNMSKAMLERYKQANELRLKYSKEKPEGVEEITEAIEEMESALTSSGHYTAAIKEQADGITNLADKFQFLHEQIIQVSDAYQQLKGVTEAYMQQALRHGDGAWYELGGLFKDTVLENMKDVSKSSIALDVAENNVTQVAAAVKAVMKQALGKDWKIEYEKLDWKDIYREMDADQQAKLFGNFFWNTAFHIDRKVISQNALAEAKEALDAWKDAYDSYKGDWKQITDEQLGLFGADMLAGYSRVYKAQTGEAFTLDRKDGEEYAEWLHRVSGFSSEVFKAMQSIAEENKIDPAEMQKLWKALMNGKFKTYIPALTEQTGNEIAKPMEEWMIDLQKFFEENKVNVQVEAGDTWDTIRENLKKRKKTLQEELDKDNKILLRFNIKLDDIPQNIDEFLDKQGFMLPWVRSMYKNALEKMAANNAEMKGINAAEQAAPGIVPDDKSGNKKTGSGSSEDKLAKDVRNRMRILREAANSYKYWRDKVGDKSAETHVMDEFGKTMESLGYSFDNIEHFKKTLDELRDKNQKVYDTTGKKRPQLLEAIKEIEKALADLNRSDFEQNTEKFVSKMKKDIEDLTRKWEIFNSVRQTTGNEILASRLSGITPGATPADLKRANVAAFAGVDIDFTEILKKSEEEIDKYVESLGVSEDKIAAVKDGLKDWKSAEEQQTTSDIESYAKWLGSLVDLQSIRNRNQEEYNRTVEETNRLLKAGQISEEEATKRKANAALDLDNKNWQATSTYSSLYNNAQGMAASEFSEAYSREQAIINAQYKAGIITLEDYASKMDKLNKIAESFDIKGFLGIKGGVGSFLSGGYEGLIQYHRDKATTLRAQGKEDEAKEEESRAESMTKAKKAGEELVKTFQDLSNVSNMLGDMFSALGMEGAANAFGDAAGVLGGIAGGAQSLSAFGPWGMAAGAAIGGITSIAQLHDKQQQRVIDALKDEVEALQENTEAIKRSRERTLGYDDGVERRRMARLYKDTSTKNVFASALMGEDVYMQSAARKAMQEYYGKNSEGDGYTQEFKNLTEEREKYMKMYDEENEKKDESQDALDEYKEKIAELDDQIMFYTEDLANQLWGLDLKGWADQFGDALMTAFENGEDAAEAFDETASDIMRNLVKSMATQFIIEPMFDQLRNTLFGTPDENGIRQGGAFKKYSNGTINFEESQEEVAKAIAEALGPTGYIKDSVDDAMKMIEQFNGYGIEMRNQEKNSSGSGSIKSITEETANLLMSYVNAIRADVSVDRALFAQYIPSIFQQMTSANSHLGDMRQKAEQIARSNDAIERHTAHVSELMDGLRNKTWRMPMA